ncbi:hypothetical protein [Boseongicola sp. H5]|uniref:hypothetical protein n=1 Tax=Boseongicola sp. H5 TaxID=2763261 RepID=UPI001D0B7729|nr:hypothetical protein [Boseongicola sp. H5]
MTALPQSPGEIPAAFVAACAARDAGVLAALSAQNTDIVPGAETQLASANGLHPQDYGRS